MSLFSGVLAAQEETKKNSFWRKMKGETYAVIVGISDYEDVNIPDLQFAHRDAEAFKNYLQSPSGGNISQDNITLLLNEDATGGNVHKAMYELLKKAGSKDKCVIYFSGHGDVETIFQDEPGHLLLYDTPAEIYQINSLRVNDLKRIVSTLSTKNEAQVYIYTDACRSGNLSGSEVNGAQATAAALNAQFSNEVKLMSCQANEYSVEGTQWGEGRGVFSYHLIDGLSGLADADENGTVSLQELERYLEDEIENDLDDHKQSPVVIGDKGTKMAFVHEESLQALKEDKGMVEEEVQEQELLAVRGPEVDSSDVLELFYQAINEGNLISYDSISFDNSAEYYYGLVAADELYASKAPIAKGDFISALQDGAQKELNLYLQTDTRQMLRLWANDYHSFEAHAEYLDKAVSLLDQFHYLYPQLKAKALYFNNVCHRLKLLSGGAPADSFQLLEKDIQMALSMQPRSPYLHNEMGHIYFHQGKWDDAEREYSEALKMSPRWVWPLNNLYEVNYNGKKNYRKAIKYALEGLEIDGNFSPFYEKAAYAFFQSGKIDSAIIFQEMYIRSLPDDCDKSMAKALNDLSVMLNVNNEKERAIEMFYKSIECDSSNSWAYENLSWMLVDANRLDSAESVLEKAISNNVITAAIYGNLGLLNQFRNNTESAKQNYYLALEIDSSSNIRIELIELLMREGEYANARTQLKNYMDITKAKNKFAYFNLACLDAIDKDLAGFEKNIKLAIEMGVVTRDEMDACNYFDEIRKKEAFIRVYEQLP